MSSCNNDPQSVDTKCETSLSKENGVVEPDKTTALSCKLTSMEFQKRKEEVLNVIKKKQLERKELSNGISFRFDGSDETIDFLTEFIKTERACCDFFRLTWM